MSLGQEDFIEISQSLLPSPNYELELALGTCYSSDFKTILFLLYRILGYPPFEEEADDFVAQDQQLMKAFFSLREKVRILYHPGHYKTIEKSDFACFMDEIVREYPIEENFSFHPKTFLLKFKHRTESKYEHRLLILSRNFTENVCLDVFFAGKLEKIENGSDKLELSKFAEAMARSLAEADQKKFESFAKELASYSIRPLSDEKEITMPTFFWQDGKIELGGKLNPLLSLGQRIVLVSPFLDLKGLKALIEHKSKWQDVFLISESSTLEELCYDEEFVAYIKEKKIKTYSTRAGEGTPDLMANIHAKVFLIEQSNSVQVIMGSANITDRGLNGRNIEAIVSFNIPNVNLDQVFLEQWVGQNSDKRHPIVLPFEMIKKKGKAPRDRERDIKNALSHLKIDVHYKINDKTIEATLYFHNIHNSLFVDGMVIEVRPITSNYQKSLLLVNPVLSFKFESPISYTSQYIIIAHATENSHIVEIVRTLEPCQEVLNLRRIEVQTKIINEWGIFKQLEFLLKPIAFDHTKKKRMGKGKSILDGNTGGDFPVNLEELFINCLERPEVVNALREVFQIPEEGLNQTQKEQFKQLKQLWESIEGAFE